MDLTKLMNKNSQQVKPEPEQPEFSKEEYAAMKKAEREQLWERIDTLTADVLKDAESLRDFLDFVAQCSPERIENLLLVPFPVSWTVKMKKKQKETQDILSYHSQAAGCSDKARAKASGGRQPIEECGRTGL